MNKDDILQVLSEHAKWLKDGTKSKRADLIRTRRGIIQQEISMSNPDRKVTILVFIALALLALLGLQVFAMASWVSVADARGEPPATHTPRPTSTLPTDPPASTQGCLHGKPECETAVPSSTPLPPSETSVPTQVATEVPPTQAPETATPVAPTATSWVPITSTPGASPTPQGDPTSPVDCNYDWQDPQCQFTATPVSPTGTPKPKPYGLTVHTALDLMTAQFCTPVNGTYYVFAFSSPSKSWSEGGLEEWDSHARATWVANAGDCDSPLLSFWLPFPVSNEFQDLVAVWFVPTDGSLPVKMIVLNGWLGEGLNVLDLQWP